jgi:stage III sporulation protein AD
MEQVMPITLVCVTTAALGLAVKKGAPELALVLGLAAAVAALLALAGPLQTLMAFFSDLTDRAGVPGDLFIPLYKTVGIALVVKIGSGLCKDAGTAALAGAVEIVGSVCALLAALPLLEKAMDVLLDLVG